MHACTSCVPKQVGPGGLDPAEVFETLPKVLQEAFGEARLIAASNHATSRPVPPCYSCA